MLAEKHEPSVSSFRMDLAALEPFAVAFRYPTVREPDRAAAEEAVLLASRVVREVDALIIARPGPP